VSETRGAEFAGQHIAVIGLAATGLATARVLRDVGATVTVYDSKPEEKLDAARVAEARALDGVMLALSHSEADWQRTDLIVPSPGVPRYALVLEEAVRRGVPILGEIEVAYRLAQAPILAITGTNGKTTTTALLGAICREAGLKTWVAGNIAEDAGVRLPLIQAAVEAPAAGVIVAEISSFQLEWVEQFRPKVAAWLNISPDHMDRHRDMDEYARAKSNIFRAQTEDDFAVLNADDEMVMCYSEGIGKGERVTFSATGHTKATFTWDGFRVVQWHDDSHWSYGVKRTDIQLPGVHNIANILAATAAAEALGIYIDFIEAAIRGFKGVAHRMEFVREVGGVRYLNNSMCTNPTAVAASVAAVETPLVAIAGGMHKGGDLADMARALAAKARHVVLIGVSAPEIAGALRDAGLSAVEQAKTLPEAVARAAAVAKPGETIMLVPGCASFDMFTGFEQRGQVFRDAVNALTTANEGSRT
jgi:UDP-N-acetylmuramoylalanine--D-glutamate ligase